MNKILLLNEASMFNSGLGKYGKNLLSNLKKRGYKVAELGFGCSVNPPSDHDITWRTYYNEVLDNDPRKEAYKTDPDNRFGKWRLDKVVLDWQPDYLLSILDPWNTLFIPKSPTRYLYNYIAMPTFDSFPIKDEWMSAICNADKVMTYSDWAVEHCKIPIFGTPRYGVNPEEFFLREDKNDHKIRYGLDPNKFIIGCIMKNQPRKKFGDLFECFSKIVKEIPEAMLYLHTAWPEQNPWNLPRLLMQYELQDKVLFTYFCNACNDFYPSLYKGDYTYCKKCFQKAALIKSSAYSISDKNFNDIYNFFDIYMQYANSEGAGMPVAEAAFCGLQTFVIDYTAMEDYKNTIASIPIKPLASFWDQHQEAYRATIDNDAAAKAVIEFHKRGKTAIKACGISSMNLAKNIYNWEKVVDVWEACIKSVPPKQLWKNKPKFITSQLSRNATPKEIIFFMKTVMNIKDPISLITLFEAMNSEGAPNRNITRASREAVIKDLNNWINYYNKCENIRTGGEPLQVEDYIEYARIKEKVHEDSIIIT